MDTLFSTAPRTALDQVLKTWRQPQELNGSRPREVGLTRQGKFMMGTAIGMILIGIFVGISLYSVFSRDHAKQSRIARYGLDAEAVITRHGVSDNGKSHDYFLEYDYPVEGKIYHGQRSIEYKVWSDLVKKGRIPVRYLPADPAKHSTPGYQPEVPPPWMAVLLAAIFFLCSGIVIRIIVIQCRLLAEGLSAPAAIVRVKAVGHGKKIAYYAFVDRNNTLFNGKTGPYKSPPLPGAIIDIIYEQENEKNNAAYPLPFAGLKNYR
jgi:hypothetical protein